MTEPSNNIAYETQQQRWVKYGLNVLITCVVVVVLAGLVIWLAQRKNARIDTTAQRVYSLKPQTLNVLNDLKQKVRIVSLYERPRDPRTADQQQQASQADVVGDLLEEYKRHGKNVEVENIDPKEQPTKVDDLIKEVTNKYGGEIEQYRKVVEDFGKTSEEIKSLASGEADKVAKLPLETMQGNDTLQSLVLALITVQTMPQQLEDVRDRVNRMTKTKLPDFKGAVDRIDSGMQTLSTMTGQIVDDFTKAKAGPGVPEDVRKYVTESLPRYEQMKKLSDAMHDRIAKLGELKLDDLRQQLRERNSILVMTDKEMRTVPETKVWQVDKEALRAYAASGGELLRPRFAGEQQLSAAIVSLNRAKKPRVAFVRPGGPPLAGGASPFERPGPLSRVANRLRDADFDVVEKDLSGMYAMQAQMQGMPGPKEPTDEELKDAVWVVLAYPSQPSQMGMPPQPIGPRVAEHLKNGGSALIIPFPDGEDLAAALASYGIQIHNNVVAVHEKIELAEGSEDIERAKQYPFVFMIKDYGDHPLAAPLKSLDGLFAPILQVTTSAPPASTQPTTQPVARSTPLLPVPGLMKVWGESDIRSLEQAEQPKFEPDKGDVPGPLFGGAAAEKGQSRVVVIGAPQFMFNNVVAELDPTLARQRVPAPRFPGNAELFQNAILWLSKMDTMLAISPTAMETPRLKDMTEASQRFWRTGVLLVALPALVIVAGVGVYFARRE